MNKKISEETKELVVVRLQTIPPNKKISIGNYGEFSKDELIKNVREESEIGKKIIEIELEFLRAIKKGVVISETI